MEISKTKFRHWVYDEIHVSHWANMPDKSLLAYYLEENFGGKGFITDGDVFVFYTQKNPRKPKKWHKGTLPVWYQEYHKFAKNYQVNWQTTKLFLEQHLL